jgi:hypothetical protein
MKRTELLELGLRLRSLMYLDGIVKKHRYRFSTFKDCFIGKDAVIWCVNNEQVKQSTKKDATRLLDDLLTAGCLHHVKREHSFKDAYLFYRWSSENDIQNLLKHSINCGGEALELSASTLLDCRNTLVELHGRINRRVMDRRKIFMKKEKPLLEKAIQEINKQLSSIKKLETSPGQLEKLERLEKEKDILYLKLHFPGKDDEWAFRGGTDGVYMGSKSIAVETLETTWDISLSSKNGVSITMDPININLLMNDFSLIADKNSGLPNFKRDLLGISTKMKFSTNVCQDTTDTSSTSKWKINSFTFECIEISRLEGGSLIPTSILTWLINSFVPSRLKKIIIDSLPSELNDLLSSSTSSTSSTNTSSSSTTTSFELGGEFLSYGLPQDVLNYNFKMGKNLRANDDDISNNIKNDVHRSALRLLLCKSTDGNTYMMTPKHGHILEKARRRLGLANELKAMNIFSTTSKFENLNNIINYAIILKEEAINNEYIEIINEWNKAIQSFCIEDHIKPILNIELILQSALLLHRQPQELTIRINKTGIHCNCNSMIDFIRIISLKALEEQKNIIDKEEEKKKKKKKKKDTATTVYHNNTKSKNIALGVEKIAEVHRDTHEMLKYFSFMLQPSIGVSLNGELLSGKLAVFDIGGRYLNASINPCFQFNFPSLDIAPSDSSISMYAVEVEDGRFVVDLGIPTIDFKDETTDEIKEEDPLLLLDLAKAPSAILTQQSPVSVATSATIDFAFGQNPAFPDHDRLLIINMGSSEFGLRVDPMEAKLYFDQLINGGVSGGGRSNKVKLLNIGLKPNIIESKTTTTTTTTTSIDTTTTPSYYMNFSSELPSAQLYIDVRQFHVVGSPLRFTKFISSMLLNPVDNSGGSSVGDDVILTTTDVVVTTEVKEENEQKEESVEKINDAIINFLKSFKNDLQGQHMVLQFSFDLEVISNKDTNNNPFICIHLIQTENDTDTNDDHDKKDEKKATMVFQNVYFLNDLFKTINIIRNNLK